MTKSFDDLMLSASRQPGPVQPSPGGLWDRDAEVCLLFIILFTTFVLTAFAVLVPYEDPAVQGLPNVRDARLWVAAYADLAERERREELARMFEEVRKRASQRSDELRRCF